MTSLKHVIILATVLFVSVQQAEAFKYKKSSRQMHEDINNALNERDTSFEEADAQIQQRLNEMEEAGRNNDTSFQPGVQPSSYVEIGNEIQSVPANPPETASQAESSEATEELKMILQSENQESEANSQEPNGTYAGAGESEDAILFKPRIIRTQASYDHEKAVKPKKESKEYKIVLRPSKPEKIAKKSQMRKPAKISRK